MRRYLNSLPFKFGDKSLEEFRDSKVPILWITGASHAGKTELANFLSEVGNYYIIPLQYLTPGRIKTSRKASKDYLNLMKEEIRMNFKLYPGFIIDDFPCDTTECQKFIRKVCNPTLVIYISITLDAALGRALAKFPEVDLNAVRVDYVKQAKFACSLFKKFELKNRVLKVFSQYPIQDTHARVVEMLETEFNVKFK